jgi:hypothetical protein
MKTVTILGIVLGSVNRRSWGCVHQTFMRSGGLDERSMNV